MYGADQFSQDFLDETIEDNVARCGHARPVARPDPRLKQPPLEKIKKRPQPKKTKDVAKAETPPEKSAPAPAAEPRGWWRWPPHRAPES